MELARRLLEDGHDAPRCSLRQRCQGSGAVSHAGRYLDERRQARVEVGTGRLASVPAASSRPGLGRLVESPPDEPAGGGVVNLFEHFTAIAEQFTLQPVAVDTILFKADLACPALPHDYFWSPYVRAELRVERAAGNHLTMFDPVNGPSLGARLEAILDEGGERGEVRRYPRRGARSWHDRARAPRAGGSEAPEPVGQRCVVLLHGKGGEGDSTEIDEQGVATIRPTGNAEAWMVGSGATSPTRALTRR